MNRKISFFKNKKGNFFLKYFFVFSSIVLASFFVIGIALMIFATTTISSQTLKDTKAHATELSKMTSELLGSSEIQDNPRGAVLTLCKNIELLSKSTNCDAFITDKDGNVIVCPHTMSGFDLSTAKMCETHAEIKIPSTYLQRVKNGTVTEFSTLNGAYDGYHSISMMPIYVNHTYQGVCVVASPISDNLVNYIEKAFIMFVVSAAIALVVVTIAVSLMTEHIAKPIRELENATKCYASGDFSYRVPELNSNDELAELITKFNAMATSLSQIEDSRRSFVANVSHEFKTPMTTIGGFINGILDGTIPPEKQGYYLNIVSSEIKRLSKMVNMMLNISKIETGNVNMKIEKFDISQKLVTTFLGFEQLISEKNIEVNGFEDLVPAVIHGDSAMIDQAIYNLADNAVKFTEKGGKITVNTACDNNYVYFAITNTGKGIPEKDLEKVFQRFYKVDESRSTDVKSTGLGLYLIKSIIDLHNGTITLESEVDKFTRFTVRLPK